MRFPDVRIQPECVRGVSPHEVFNAHTSPALCAGVQGNAANVAAVTAYRMASASKAALDTLCPNLR